MSSACCWLRGLSFGRGRDSVVVLYISLFLQVLWWWFVRVYERARTQTQAMWILDVSPVVDGHLKPLVTYKNPDRLKLGIHVDHICVQSPFVCIYMLSCGLTSGLTAFFLCNI